MSWQQLIHTVLTDRRLYRRALGALAVSAAVALPVFVLVLVVK